MIFFLPLIALVAANPCPYCKWNACSFTIGSIPNCSACYDVAALVPIKLPSSSLSSLFGPFGVCQLCPSHCSSCQYALAEPSYAQPIPIINCTSCAVGYTTHHFTGKCEACPSNCDDCHFQVLAPANSMPYPVINCTSCHSGFTNNYFSGDCQACPQHCSDCSCQGKGCPTIVCNGCEEGYVVNGSGDGCIPQGGRLLMSQEDKQQ